MVILKESPKKMEEIKGSGATILRIKGNRVKCNSQGFPLKDHFLRLLLPDPAGKGERIKVQKGDKGPDYIEDLDAYIARIAKKIGTYEEDIRENITYTKKGNPPKRNVISEDDPLRDNTQVVHALGLVLSSLNQEKERDFAIYIKDTALPFIKAIRSQGPLYEDDETKKRPEPQGEALFGVSQRIDQLGLSDKIESRLIPVIGKRALELYKEVYPGETPPQRVIYNEEHDREYLMNLYTERTAKDTLDVAIQEQRIRKKKKRI